MKTTLNVGFSNVLDIFAPGPQGIQGEKGEQGDVGSSAVLHTVTAGEILFGHRVVRIANGMAYVTNCLDRNHVGEAIGLTTGAATVGQQVQIQLSGILTEDSWNFFPGRVYLSQTGTLTSTPPTSGFLQLVGRAISPQTILILLPNPIILE